MHTSFDREWEGWLFLAITRTVLYILDFYGMHMLRKANSQAEPYSATWTHKTARLPLPNLDKSKPFIYLQNNINSSNSRYPS